MSGEEGEEERRDPEISEAEVVNEGLCLVADDGRDRVGPDLWAKVARHNHDGAGEDQAFGRAVEVAQVKSVGVVGLPC